MTRTSALFSAAFTCLAGCTCAPERAPEAPPTPTHFSEWEPLVAAVVDGRAETVHVMARDMAGGAPGGNAEIGSALGFLQLAEGPELADGLAAAAVACGPCHTEQNVVAPPAVPWSHRTAALHLLDGAVWGREAFPRIEDGDVRRAWDGAETLEARIAAVLVSCQGCHAAEPVVAESVVESLCEGPCGGRLTLWRPEGGAVDRISHAGDLSRCSHVMHRWAEIDGSVAHSASDKPTTPERAAEFRAAVDTFMGERRIATFVECDAGDGRTHP